MPFYDGFLVIYDKFWSSWINSFFNASEFSKIHFNLSELIQGVDDLDDLAIPFTTEEINNQIQNLPSTKSSGPDGFNTDFMKKCWGHCSKLLWVVFWIL
jgi:hypothetical protein